MLDLLLTAATWAQWALIGGFVVCLLCALGFAALWCWATSVRYDEVDEE